MKWSRDEVQRIAQADDFHVAPLREDGVAGFAHRDQPFRVIMTDRSGSS